MRLAPNINKTKKGTSGYWWSTIWSVITGWHKRSKSSCKAKDFGLRKESVRSSIKRWRSVSSGTSLGAFSITSMRSMTLKKSSILIVSILTKHKTSPNNALLKLHKRNTHPTALSALAYYVWVLRRLVKHPLASDSAASINYCLFCVPVTTMPMRKSTKVAQPKERIKSLNWSKKI